MTAACHPGPFDAVVLAGGAGRRMGGVDKAELEVGGRRLLDRVLDAVAHARRTVVVGPERTTSRPVAWTREAEPGGGPAPALAAGLGLVEAPQVVVLAADLPHVTADVVDALRAAATGDGAVLLDDSGREQPLISCWSTAALRGALAGRDLAGASLRSLLGGLQPASVPAGGSAAWLDCDTPDDLRRARERA